MTSLKSKRKLEAQIENLSKEPEKTKKTRKKKSSSAEEETTPIVETPVEETPVSPYMNEAEQTALAEQHERDTEESNKVSFDKMEETVRVVSESFNLSDKGFSVNGFSDKGSKVQLSVSNGDFDLVVTVKDAEKFGII